MREAKRRIFEIIQIGRDQDIASIAFDFFIAVVIFINLFVTLIETFDFTGVFPLRGGGFPDVPGSPDLPYVSS